MKLINFDTYILDENDNEVKEEDTIKWSIWMEKNFKKLRIDFIKVEDYRISTLFYGINYFKIISGKPLLYETKLFIIDPENKEYGFTEVKEKGLGFMTQRNYNSKEGAIRGHIKMVEDVKKLVKKVL